MEAIINSKLKIQSSKLRNRYIITIILLTITTLIVSNLQYKPTQDNKIGLTNLQKIPMNIGKWKGQDVTLDETVYDILETRAIIHRSFTADNEHNVFLSIVHYHDTKVDFHAPEACLGGRGLKTQKQTKTITLFSGAQKKTIEIAQIITTKPDNQTLTYYFFKAGNFIGSNYIKMRLSIAANKFARNDTKGSLIRISTTQLHRNKSAAELQLIDFLEEILPYIQKSL